ncbi:hypothetical protein E4665_15710 [Sporolactobacillus shoreae]|uniref:Uncharacterized protein n=1 Tax=Sporolactobacillus shoreae TaxID=1465501 RepID=A0A4Z0GK55_9BACL|nr:hypothetical protein E4665_15710 [Sporolactobacillus shoreae]
MKTFLYSLIFSLIIALGIFGLLTKIFSNPTALLVQLLILAAIIAVGLFFFKRLAEGTGNADQALYRRAAKQSLKRRKITSISRKFRGIHPSRFKVISSGSRSFKELSRQSIKEHGHLTVIEGKKNKKKKRVLF